MTEDTEAVPWAEFARLKLIEEKAAQVHELAIPHSHDDYVVHADAIAELGAALEGRRSDI